MPLIRALFLDIDGTLVGSTGTVSPRVVAAIGRARAAGCEVVLCTGRSRLATEPVADQLGFRGYGILSNGGVVMHLGSREVLCRNLLPVPLALQAVRAFIQAGAAPQVYEDAIESARVLYHPDYPVKIWDADRYRSWPAMLEDLPFEPVSVGSYGPESVLRPLAARLTGSVPGTHVEQAGALDYWGVGIFPGGGGKCSGLQRVIDRLGIRREQVVAIGDHINDLEMLRFAGTGVAMGNALSEVKDAADQITGSLQEDGVAQAIERWVLAEA
jgi:hydroxymethylpyrimidine pyrophosphatase-like HAD family hydrolase